MKYRIQFIFWILFASIPSLAFAQYPYKDCQEWETETYRLKAQKGWDMDSYNCIANEWCGFILLFREPDVRIILYANGLAKLEESNHDHIRNVDWDPQSGTPITYTSASGIVFEGFEGKWKNEEFGHKVLRLQAHKNNHYVRIFIFGSPEDMASQVDKYHWFLDHFKWK